MGKTRPTCTTMFTTAIFVLLALASVEAFMPSASFTGVGRFQSSLSMAAKTAVKKADPKAKKVDTKAKKAPAKKAAPALSSKQQALLAKKAATDGKEPEIIPGLGLGGPVPDKSLALPFAPYPKTLDGTMVGDVGFDPLGLADTPEKLATYRNAEIKHGRLAMLAVVGWLVSEEEDFALANFFDLPTFLQETDGRAPSVLNGGLEQVPPVFWAIAVFTAYVCELVDEKYPAKSGIIGDLEFDPAGFFPEGEIAQQRMRLAELKHGRIAMLAITIFAADEDIFGIPVIDLIKDETGGAFPIPAEDISGYNKFEGLVSMAGEAASMVGDALQHLG